MGERTTDNNIKDSMDMLFDIGKVIFVFIIVLFIIVHNSRLDNLLNYTPKCAIKKATGLDCPGCGMTRACVSILRFQFLDSIKYNAAVMYGFICYVAFMIVQGCHVYFGTKSFNRKCFSVIMYIGIGIVLIHFFIKLFLHYINLM